MEWDLNYNLTLNDTSVIRPIVWFMMGSKAETGSLYQKLGLSLEHRPVVMFIPFKGKFLLFKGNSQQNRL